MIKQETLKITSELLGHPFMYKLSDFVRYLQRPKFPLIRKNKKSFVYINNIIKKTISILDKYNHLVRKTTTFEGHHLIESYIEIIYFSQIIDLVENYLIISSDIR